ncbi:MAG: tyrosine-type recombinase/integrase [Steroidobacteraceae bacterium]
MSTRAATLGPGTYTDSGQAGLQLRVRTKAGGYSRTWLLRFKFHGEETRILVGHFPQTTLEQARNIVRKHREHLGQGIDPRRATPHRQPLRASTTSSAGAVRDAHSVEFLISEFMERYVKPNRKRPEYAQAILDKDVLPEWTGRDARSIKPREVIELLDKIVDRGCRVLANRTAGLLSQLFKFGIHRSIIETSPVQLLMRPGGKERPRQRVLSDDEISVFLRDPLAATRFKRLSHVVRLLLLTGQRRGELTAARWRDIDFSATTWNIPAENSKSGRESLVPLSASAVREFEALRRLANHSQWVLPTATGADRHVHAQQLTTSLMRCRARFKQAGIAPFTLHDLRRTCRTGLARLKIEPHIAERVLGHAQERMAATYDVHDYLDEKRAALHLWAQHLDEIKASAPS